MHLLYLDDSGSVQNSSDRHVILAGVSVFERQPHWLSRELDYIAAELWPDNPQGLEFRGADIRGGKRHWRGIARDDRESAYRKALTVLSRSPHVRLFAVAVHKQAAAPADAMEVAFEYVCNRFDMMLGVSMSAAIRNVDLSSSTSPPTKRPCSGSQMIFARLVTAGADFTTFATCRFSWIRAQRA